MRVAIVFGSETGNTKDGADIIAQALTGAGHQVDVLDAAETGADILKSGYDLYLLGVSTWGAIDEEVQQDFEAFYEAMGDTDLSGVRLAVFGSGDEGYDNFAKAVDFVEKRARTQGATVVAPGFKYNLEPAPVRAHLEAWATQAAQAA